MGRERRSSRILRWIEYLLLFAGLFGVDYYIWTKVDAAVSQAYQRWEFARTLNSERGNVWWFVLDETGVRSMLGMEYPKIPKPPQTAEQKGPHVPADGEIGRVEIPRLDISVMVREGVDDSTLRNAVGHIPGTALPGQPGNAALAAHRDTYFRPLRNVRRGDRVYVTTTYGEYVYKVETTQIVKPDDISVLDAADYQELTLVTCFPFYYIGSAPKRFVVHARQIAAYPLKQQVASAAAAASD